MSRSDAQPKSRLKVLDLAPYTVVLHALIPVAIALTWKGHEELIPSIIVGVHVVFPVVLVVTFRYWRSQILELIGLVIANHLITFISTVAVLAWLDG